MDKLIELVMRNPLILLIVGAWVVGMVANAVKAQKKVRERREQAMGPSPVATKEASTTPQAQKGPREVVAAMGSGQQKRLPERRQMPGAARSVQPTQATPPPVAGGRTGATSPDDIAAEMRRIFGLDSKPRATTQPAPPASPARSAPPEIQIEPELINRRRVHVRSSIDSHVGEKAHERRLKKSTVGQSSSHRGAIGNLGGRVSARRKKKQPRANRRFPLDDLKRLIVMNEILSPPVSLRDSTQNSLF
jgi:hypothetical protein